MIRYAMLLLWLSTSTAFAQITPQSVTEKFQPNIKPKLDLQETTLPIKIDGEMDEAAWQQASVAINFSENFPDQLAEPPIGIKVLALYDQDNLYIAYFIEDNPNDIRVSKRNRDEIWQDDYVGAIIDTYNNNAWAYFIAANPLGIQGDTRIVSNGNEDVGFNVLFTSEGKVTETGYQVEMAIPFSSLRFPNRDVQTWNFNFWITQPRDSRNTYSWAGIDPDNACWICQFGTISGIEGIKSGKNQVELLPALIGSNRGYRVEADNPNAAFINDPITLKDSFDPSLNVRYSLNSSSTAELALNPDFSQIESDQAQIDVNTTFALFYPERRPFFQEGSDLLNTWVSAVYTRSINDPILATKLTGRFEKTNVAYIGARDENSAVALPFAESSASILAGKSYANILRVRQNLKNDSYIGALVTDRRYDFGGSGSNVGLDAFIRLDDKHQIEAQIVGSQTQEADLSALGENDDPTYGLRGQTFGREDYTANFDGESYRGVASYLSVERNAQKWSWDVDYWTTSPTFRADNGRMRQNNRQRVSMFQMYTFYPKTTFIDRLQPDVLVGYEWDYDRIRKDQYVWLGLRAMLKGQTSFGTRLLAVSNEHFQGIEFRGMQRIIGFLESNFSSKLGFGVEASYGDEIARQQLVMGTSTNIGVRLNIKPLSQFVMQPELNYFKLVQQDNDTELFSGYIARMRLSYQFTRALSMRTVLQYNDFSKGLNIEPLLTYQANPFTVFYIGANWNTLDANDTLYPQQGFYTTGRSVFFKFQYLFRV